MKRALPYVFFVLSLLVAGWFGAHTRDRGPAAGSQAAMADAPPGVRFVTVALGGFRGLLADVLWVRAAELQDKGHFFEVAQLASWITRLEPRYPEVWSYHAWNMAYNITAVVPDPADRWHWVRNGVRLLRDEGIPSNPTHPRLYWELGWMFYDKVGGRWDDATLFYRVSWAREMAELFPAGTADYQGIAANPGSARMLKAAGLNLDTLKAVDAGYGPLDWHLPESHMIYWGFSGCPFQEPDSPWCERLLWMGLLETVKGGGLVFFPEQQVYRQGPRLDVAVKGVQLCAGGPRDVNPLVGLVQENFLRESILILSSFGRPVEAGVALVELQRRPGVLAGSGPVDVFLRDELMKRLKVYDAASRKEVVLRFMVQSDAWTRLKVVTLEDGYLKLARLHWDAWRELDKAALPWESLMEEARARSLREMPLKVPPQTP